MAVIRQMDHRLANMIAAGEVVDRPASVIKELIENAIDAHATSISVDVFDMGMSLMRVTDNGIGMDKIDAKTAFSRHATSKIKDEYDLSHIKTLGFRGEALAAIASVSKVMLKTRMEHSDGVYVLFEGGHQTDEGSASLNVGTIVEVKDLFFNTPARFKYIKSDYAEKQTIMDIFDRLALAHPEIRFLLTMDGKKVKETYGNQDFHQLIDRIYGSRMTEGLITFEKQIQKITIKGYLLSPQIVRSRKKDISIFVNGRYIKNYALIQAVVEGYHSFLMVGKYPIALIHIMMDPSLLDCNVHPQKYEVKFVNESMLAYAIEGFIKEALVENKHEIPKGVVERSQEESNVYTPTQMSFYEPETETIIEEKVYQKIPDMTYVGVFSGTYLIFQNEMGMYLVDQHAAAERVRYEHYVKVLANPTKTRKQMLLPYTLKLTDEDHLMIKEHIKAFDEQGFSFNDQLELKSSPTWLRDEEIDLAIEAMLTMLQSAGTIDLSKLRDALAKDISCKGAIKANKALSIQEIEHLMKQLSQCENPYHCPHGRPTMIKWSNYDIERMFKRIV
ncbi:MAG: DNA mismatch repair endonuclease MutL [Acholeplasmataceae bacterium]|jgi:DNA mismatch repair protein MutL|nr:DNA mismatch repair endonuclease MutL [Acholeplasmataceae bacterium]